MPIQMDPGIVSWLRVGAIHLSWPFFSFLPTLVRLHPSPHLRRWILCDRPGPRDRTGDKRSEVWRV